MSKFIVPVHMGDDCTWSATEYVAVECESMELLYASLVDAIKHYMKEYEGLMVESVATVCGSKLDLRWFTYRTSSGLSLIDPSIMTLDEWFNSQINVDWG